MKLQLHRLELPLEHEFTIARGSMRVAESLVVELEQDGVSGFGESTANPYYGHTLDSMSDSIVNCREIIEGYQFGSPSELWAILQSQIVDDPFALSAVDLAAYDLFGKLNNQYTYDVLGLQWADVPDSSYTIGIDSIEKMIAKLNAKPDWSIYKIKLGTERDVEIVRRLREATDAVLRVDANCGWSVDEAIANSVALKELGVQFIEQPLPANAPIDDKRRVYDESQLPIIADESCATEPDVQRCQGCFHGVNVKLCKCGGLTPAARMLRQARSMGMKTMVGCMVESTVGISGAAQLLPLLDFADLDGAELLSDQARRLAFGVSVSNGKISLPSRFGSGVELSF